MKNKFTHILLLIIAVLSVCSCEDMLDVDLPSDLLTVEAVFSDSTTIESAVNALYTQNFYYNPLFYYLVPYYAGAMSDEAYHDVTSLEVFNQNSYTPTTSAVANIWTYGYQTIYLSNSLIEKLWLTEGIISEKKIRSSVSEAKYFRAYAYFVLLNFYGEVPLIVGSDYKEAMIKPRDRKSVV